MYDKLVEQLRFTQATLFSFMTKVWGFHWNVEGESFAEYHKFFGDIYTQAFADIDMVSEHIRMCEAMAPAALSKFLEVSQIKDNVVPMTGQEMIRATLTDIETIIGELEDTRQLAEEANKIGIMADAEAMISAYDKMAWMVRSYKK